MKTEANTIPNCFVVEIKIHNFEMKISFAHKSGREETEEAQSSDLTLLSSGHLEMLCSSLLSSGEPGKRKLSGKYFSVGAACW